MNRTKGTVDWAAVIKYLTPRADLWTTTPYTNAVTEEDLDILRKRSVNALHNPRGILRYQIRLQSWDIEAQPIYQLAMKFQTKGFENDR